MSKITKFLLAGALAGLIFLTWGFSSSTVFGKEHKNPGDIELTGVICKTEGVAIITKAARESEQSLEDATDVALKKVWCIYSNRPVMVRLVTRLHSFMDYEGDRWNTWEVKILAAEEAELKFYTWVVERIGTQPNHTTSYREAEYQERGGISGDAIGLRDYEPWA